MVLGNGEAEHAEIGKLFVHLAGEMIVLVPLRSGTARHLACHEAFERVPQRRDGLAFVEVHFDRSKTGARFSEKARTASA
jgi:hypothetical protein